MGFQFGDHTNSWPGWREVNGSWKSLVQIEVDLVVVVVVFGIFLVEEGNMEKNCFGSIKNETR